ncbi:MAG TPA: nucleotidyltransferase family protein [Edaphobacter sp.]|uniref:nucleotidyltransferase family protein n=1 Tax=Edaphobacter sp. TaxID=1934404 RepID=UPI002C366D58|nr:nucleotidyltransferase family protein [Edaphobacter sp.]HUZ95794.1 nucleotidyltransferase family protein [Edaphobacter sp.]
MDGSAGIAAVVLAAGASRRLGSPKQLAMLDDETLLERAVRLAHEAGCSPVIVVLGAEYERVLAECRLGDAVPVMNDSWEEGMGWSIRLGVRACEAADGVVVMTCDQPAVTVGHLQALMRGPDVKASSYAGRKGVPAFFPKRYFDELMALSGDMGARNLLRPAEAVELEGGELDVDAAGDLDRARELFGDRPLSKRRKMRLQPLG